MVPAGAFEKEAQHPAGGREPDAGGAAVDYGNDYGGGGGIEDFLPPEGPQARSPSQQGAFPAQAGDRPPGTDASVER